MNKQDPDFNKVREPMDEYRDAYVDLVSRDPEAAKQYPDPHQEGANFDAAEALEAIRKGKSLKGVEPTPDIET